MSNSAHPLWLIGLTIVLAFIPLLVGTVTSYLKVSIVFAMLRSGLGSQQVPSNIVIMAISLATTLFIMSPTLERTTALGKDIDFTHLTKQPSLEALNKLKPLCDPWREFMAQHVGQRELKALLLVRSGESKETLPKESNNQIDAHAPVIDPNQVSYGILIPAFVLSEIKEAFAMAFVVLLPFLIIDLVVANILAALGMFMMSPVMISLPLKLLLFVVSDGWLLLTRGLINSYSLG